MSIKKLQKEIIAFRNARDWKQFHTPKNCATHLILEAAELLELFSYKDEREQEEFVKSKNEDIADELSDVLYWTLLMAHDFDIDLEEAFAKKLKKNAKKYPVEKARGSQKKYSEL